MKAEPEGGGLPAPYRSPWSALRDDLGAVAASLRLKLWELTRLNREGALPLPSRWPSRLAPFFWPLVLLFAFAAVTALAGMLMSPTPASTGEPPGRAAPELPPPPSADRIEPEPPAEPPLDSPPGPLSAEAPEADAAPPSEAEEPAPSPQEPDPLLLQLGRQGQADPLLVQAEPRPAAGVLRLTLTAGFSRLSRQERQARAEHWQDQAARLGYERLDLRDAGGRPLGRNALVGSGMILLDPDPT